VRASAKTFFSPGTGDLVGTAIDPDEMFMDCYRLADRFHQSPDVFLSMPITDVARHVRMTIKLNKLQREAQERARADDDD
jgi:hypothetical protein